MEHLVTMSTTQGKSEPQPTLPSGDWQNLDKDFTSEICQLVAEKKNV